MQEVGGVAQLARAWPYRMYETAGPIKHGLVRYLCEVLSFELDVLTINMELRGKQSDSVVGGDLFCAPARTPLYVEANSTKKMTYDLHPLMRAVRLYKTQKPNYPDESEQLGF